MVEQRKRKKKGRRRGKKKKKEREKRAKRENGRNQGGERSRRSRNGDFQLTMTDQARRNWPVERKQMCCSEKTLLSQKTEIQCN